ncbi:GNAT family N-acetyltransferase [Rubritalea tangerina]|uniref:GNAT family N-acetyltransferase n=1 Tax=Rubritalea tangerina TaxID=430798 RepID=A0ABW4ZD11_9BACT
MQPLNSNNQQAAAEILAAAFASDPFMQWFSKEPDFIKHLTNCLLPSILKNGEGYLTDELDGVALWIKPGEKLCLPLNIPLLYKLVRCAGISILWKFDQLLFSKGVPAPRPDYYYLFLIGKSPSSTRKGVGSELLQYMLSKCDTLQIPAFLENSNESNIPFYQKHGFTILGSKSVAPGSPPLWYMWREPQLPES